MWDTRILRILLVILLLAILVGSALLYLQSHESAQNWPELAHLQIPVYIAALLGLLPLVLAIRELFVLLKVIDLGQPFSVQSLRIFRRLRLLAGINALYFFIGFCVFTLVTGLTHPTLVLALLVLEVCLVFAMAATTVLQRVLEAAIELRDDAEMTV